jgi:hypothetical protein
MYPLLDDCPRCGSKSLLYFPSASLVRVMCTVCLQWLVLEAKKVGRRT